jgi:histidinol-phosphate/aromatic aminotransferase/cobyric acid decarboxylase-like protein
LADSTRVHGGLDPRELARLGIERAAVLDLSVNINPWGPHPEVLRAARAADLAVYPPLTAAEAVRAVARQCALPEEHVLIGHGSTELLWAAVGALCGERPLLVARPTFSEPELAARALGLRVVALEQRFGLDLAALSRALDAHDVGAAYLCQPNNPDGSALPARELAAFFAAHPARSFLLDQAFLSLSERHAEAEQRFGDNVLVIRSLTKDHALPGLRIGYAFGAPELVARVAARRPSWMVSAPAQAAIVACCAHAGYVDEVRERLLRQRRALSSACRARGLWVSDSVTHFVLLRVGDADGLRERLLRRHAIAVRSASSFGLPEHIRVAACDDAGCSQLMAALDRELAG